jgi:putative phosphoesterase
MTDDRNMPGNIWVISDTHLRKHEILPDSFIDNVNREDIVIHLGDFTSIEVVRQLEGIARLEAVSGNCDSPEIRAMFPASRILEINGKHLGLMHGWGNGTDVLPLVRYEFVGAVDIALFGHTHIAHRSKSNGVVYFNPGSLTESREGPNSFGRIVLDDEIFYEIIDVD